MIVSDTFGRAWRIGIQNVALGVAGMPAVVDYRGRDDDFGRTMVGTVVAIADELAGAAELVLGKTDLGARGVIPGISSRGEPSTGRQLNPAAGGGRVPMKVALLAGGTGGAMLAEGLQAVLPPAP